ncbi:MAG: FecR domain-containing protein [Gemmatimonadaceae bacterium]|nr:FecR domain-containing protein [Gemmatimonadaceae bacterium]
MSATFAPIDAATITALNGGSEQALETIYRSNYDWLLARALERLKGEDAAAPRLLIATLREFWAERDGFHNSGEIEAFFNEEMRHRARATRARMAAVHRFEKAEGVQASAHAAPSADAIWRDLVAELHKPQVDAATAAKRRREHSSHGVAEHINTVAKRGNWKTPVIIAVVAAVMALGGAYWFGMASRASVINQMLGSAEAEQISTRAGQLGSVTLGDASVANLGPESRLVIVPEFGAKYRTLTVSGTARFRVASGNPEQFEARLGDVSVFSSGGVVTVRDYAEEMIRVVRVDSGSARIKVGDAEQTLAEGAAVTIDRDGNSQAASAADVQRELSWTENRLVMQELPVSDALQKLYRWYGLDIMLADSASAAKPVSMDVPLESSQAAISAIEQAAQLRFEWVNNRMTFQAATGRRAR